MSEILPIDITTANPDFRTFFKEIEATKQSRMIRDNEVDIALVKPIRTAAKSKRKQAKSQIYYDDILALAGSFTGIDAAKFNAEMYERRSIAPRPPVSL